MAEDNIDDSGDSKASFNSLLQQALTLGFRKITPSKLPQFVALIIYVALTALIAGGVHFGEPIVITAGIVLLLLAAIMSLMLTLGASISPVVLNILVVVVVLGFLGISGYAITIIAGWRPSEGTEFHSNLQDANGAAAKYFHISVAGSQSQTQSDENGYFSLRVRREDVRNGKISLRISSPDRNSWWSSTVGVDQPTVQIDLTKSSSKPEEIGSVTNDDLALPPTEQVKLTPEGTWHFIVAGDSRNCGDIVMPTIAKQAGQFAPAFYWHLGDLRAIYKVDEDMAAAAAKDGKSLSCSEYLPQAWPDFVEHQVKPFGDLPFYIGIGNHEVLRPKSTDEFKRTFANLLDRPELHRQRALDGEPNQPETYYHWAQGGVDFIYLDNSKGYFSEDQLTWFFKRLNDAMYSAEVKSVVVGMHEALPDSIANDHSMGDGSDPRGQPTGAMVYNALRAFIRKKPVYILASHSHYYLADIFNTEERRQNHEEPLPGWIAGAGGAERYLMPDKTPWLQYGYMLGTVARDGLIKFQFMPVLQEDVPASVKARYPPDLIPWCFENNAKRRPPHPTYSGPNCP